MGDRILVIAPHPDDEVIGCGGTIAKHALVLHDDVYVCVVAEGIPPMYSYGQASRTKAEDAAANAILGTQHFAFLGFPACGLGDIPQYKLNNALAEKIMDIKPDIVYIPFSGDIHVDHKVVASASMVALRPKNNHRIRSIFAYEVPSETGWDAPYVGNSFVPSVYVNIEETFGTKLSALSCIESQIPKGNSARSIDALGALAKYRGSTVGCKYAEAFMHVRSML